MTNTINTEVFTDHEIQAINFGEEGAELSKSLLLFKVLLNRGVNMKKVFLQVDYLYNLEATNTIANADLLPYLRDPFFENYLRENNVENFNANYYIPFYRYMTNGYKIGVREFTMSAVNKKANIDFKNGYAAKYGRKGDALNVVNLPDHLKGRNSLIDELMQICQVNNIELVFFTAPYCDLVNDN
ncbi:MAG: hypothetical protein HRT68_15830 [Flavobacteriaceae bacterium]|nr:hypothetical protein [Flavobacteriaceae bacterium]